jgi:pyrroline-5-carboxylate reductase
VSSQSLPATLGILGTGHIASALVAGLCTADAPPPRVLVSPRNAETAARLAARFPAVAVAPDNQAVIDASDWVVLSVRPQVAREVLGALRFRTGQTVLSLIAPIADEWIEDAVKPARLAARFLVMPPVERRLGPVAFCPPDPTVGALLARVGTTVPVAAKRDLLTIWSLTALIAPFFNFLATQADWAARNGVAPDTARAYAVAMAEALAIVAASPGAPPPTELAIHAQTKGGLNEQVMRELAAKGWFDHVASALDGILRRLQGR